MPFNVVGCRNHKIKIGDVIIKIVFFMPPTCREWFIAVKKMYSVNVKDNSKGATAFRKKKCTSALLKCIRLYLRSPLL